MSKFKDINKDGFCKFDKKGVVSTRRKNREWCCSFLTLERREIRTVAYDHKNTGLLENLDKENKWCRFEDCYGVSIEDSDWSISPLNIK